MNARVVLADETLKESLDKLKNAKIEDKKLYAWLNRAFDDLVDDPFCGIQIPKKVIPRVYIRKYGIDNLWKYNLPNAWRLIYSVARDEVIVIAIILEWMDHKTYERKFEYG
jgi:Txe/YoeB family toxin of Txe-Axe toxin-antitoxin module